MSIYRVIGVGHGLLPGDLLFGGEYFHSDEGGRQFRFQAYDEYGGDKGQLYLPSDWVLSNVVLSLREDARDNERERRFLLSPLEHSRERPRHPHAGRETRSESDLLESINAIAVHLFFGRTAHAKAIDSAFESFKKDLGLLYDDYRRCKYALLGAKDDEDELAFDKRYSKSVDSHFSGAALATKPHYSLGDNARLKSIDTRVLDLAGGGRHRWIEVLARLTILRKMLRGDQLDQVAHFQSGTTYQVFTCLNWRGRPSGIWIHNTKDKRGQGATRIVSFVREESIDCKIDIGTIQTQEATLQILDLSYDDVAALVLSVRDSQFSGNDANLARYIISFVDGTTYTHFERPVSATVLVKSLKPDRTKPAVSRTMRVPVESVCLNLLAILFLTEPRHAMPCWVANLDALRCVARGILRFETLLCRKMTFALGSNQPFYELTSSSDFPIGSLLPSNNTAKFLLPPELKHTRRLKELIMPTFELLFKHGASLIDFVHVLPTIDEAFFKNYAEQNIWVIDGLDFSQEDNPRWHDWIAFTKAKNKERRKLIGSLNEKLPSDEAAAEATLTMVRRLTFIAPIVKTLLMRMLLESKE